MFQLPVMMVVVFVEKPSMKHVCAKRTCTTTQYLDTVVVWSDGAHRLMFHFVDTFSLRMYVGLHTLRKQTVLKYVHSSI